MIERRATPRHKVKRAGTIAFVGGSVNCTIWNISPTGAALEVSSAFSIPHEITLLMAEGRLSQHCYVVWRTPTRVGVMFDRSNEPSIDLVPIGIKPTKGLRRAQVTRRRYAALNVFDQSASKSFRSHICGRLGRHAGRWFPAADGIRHARGRAGRRGLHLAVLLALADGAGFLQNTDRPAAQCPDRRRPFLRHQHRDRSCQDESLRQVVRSGC